jgi:glycosyltransferase involved in cell wall biosynthesis
MIERPRVLLLIPHLGGGGAEKVFALLARDLSREKYELHLGLVTQASAPANTFSPGVTIHSLGVSRIRFGAFRLVSLVRRLKPQIILSGMFHLNFLVLLLRPFFTRPVQILVRQNGTVSSALAFGNVPWYTRLLYRLLYRQADKVICQSAAMANDLADELRIGRNRLAVLPNPIDVAAIRAASMNALDSWAGPGPHLLAVGRLSMEKGFDLLQNALHIVRGRFPTADLVIAGDGPEKAHLTGQRRKLGLESAVRFAGHIDDPAALIPGASAFVLSSRQEGMPNALLEAAGGGLPIVALPASGGVADLLCGQPGTWLATEISASALATSLLHALDALEPGERFEHPFIEPFKLDAAIHAYEVLLDQALRDQALRDVKKREPTQ